MNMEEIIRPNERNIIYRGFQISYSDQRATVKVFGFEECRYYGSVDAAKRAIDKELA